MKFETLRFKVFTDTYAIFFQSHIRNYLSEATSSLIDISTQKDDQGKLHCILILFDESKIDYEDALNHIEFFFENYNTKNCHRVGIVRDKMSPIASTIRLKSIKSSRDISERFNIEAKVYHGDT